MQGKSSIIVVEPDPALGELFLEVLGEEGYAAELWHGPTDAAEFIRQQQPDLVILDSWLQIHGGGWLVVDALKRNPLTCTLPIIVCSANGACPQYEGTHTLRRSVTILEMPFALEALLARVSLMLTVDREHREPG